MLTHFYSTELTINEIVLSRMPIASDQTNFRQIERLYGCTESIKSWFEVFFTIPPIAYIGFPFSVFSQLVRCLITLYRLSTLDDPAWDKHSVRNTANLLAIFDQVVNNMEQVATLAGHDNNDSIGEDVFSRTAKMFRAIRPGWEAKLIGLEDPTATTLPTPPSASDTPLPLDFPMEQLDDAWLMDLFLTPNYQFP